MFTIIKNKLKFKLQMGFSSNEKPYIIKKEVPLELQNRIN